MTHQAAIALGQTLRVLATAPDEPAAQVTPDVVIGSHTDLEDLRRVAAGARSHRSRPYRASMLKRAANGQRERPGLTVTKYK